MRIEADNIGIAEDGRTETRLGFWRSIVVNKFSKPVVVGFLAVLGLLMAYSLKDGDMIPAALMVVALIGIIVVVGVVAYPKFGIIILFIAAYLLFIPMKMSVNFPLGTVMDGLEYILIIGFFFTQKMGKNWKMFADRLSICILAWILYNFAEVANPESVSSEAWLYTMRSTAVIILTYYIFVYQIKEVSFIRTMFKLWIALAMIAALNGFHQEYFDFFPYEKKWLYSDPLRVELLFQGGHMRKFSIFSDPVAYGYNMAAAATLCIALIFGPISTRKKVTLGFCAFFIIFCMIFSGTRGAFPLVPGALALLAILNYNKRVLIFACVAAFMFVVLIFMPSSNQNILRFQTAFRPKNDLSYKARKINQARIRPYIQKHPIGGGLGATGTWGQRFAPNSFLANFPPDSGYVRVAVEQGTIGLLIIMTMVFVALLTGINNFYLIKDPELKNYCLAMTMVVFVYNIGNYPQEAIAQYPSSVIFFFCIALIRVTKLLDDKKQQQLALAGYEN